MFNRGGRIILILFFVVTGFFCCLKTGLWAEVDTVVINELAWMGTEISANDEWIELYNRSSEVVTLDEWKIEARDGSPSIKISGTILPGGYYLLERSDDESVPGIAADLIYIGALGNNGEYLELKNSQGEIVDFLDTGAAWPAGDNSTKQSMSLFGDLSWKNSLLSGGTPRAANDYSLGPGETVPDCENGNCETTASTSVPTSNGNQSTGNTPVVPATKYGEVLINEFVSDPSDEDVEWVELYNKTARDINLNGWTLEDGSNTKTAIKGQVGHRAQSRFFVIEKPKGNLNNSGDLIILRNAAGALIDEVSYGNWDDGNLNNNAPAAKDPFSSSRLVDGQNSGVASIDFAVSSVPSKGLSNQIIAPGASSKETAVSIQYSEDIEISEVFPNPAGVDEEKEFIELYNNSGEDINICDWTIGDSSRTKYKIIKSETFACVFKSGEYLPLYRPETKLALNNSGDEVNLYCPLEKEPIKTLEYEKAIEDYSYSLNIENLEKGKPEYVWTKKASPGQANDVNGGKSRAVDFSFPDNCLIGVPIIFDSSDSELKAEEKIFYQWEFGDGFSNNLACPEHTFFKIGEYEIELSVGNENGTSTKVKTITIKNTSQDEESKAVSSSKPGKSNLLISEVLPNPIGLDGDGEFVEVYNAGDTRINLINWSIDDDYDGSTEYKFLDDVWLDAGEYYSLKRKESKLSFNNDNDAIRLYSDNDELVDEVEYSDPEEGFAYARGENSKWFWTSKPSPSKENIIKVSGATQYESSSNTDGDSVFVLSETMSEKDSEYKPVLLSELINLEIGSKIRATGTVIVLPGILGAQIFYILNDSGIQIYSYKKDFPALLMGDLVMVTGELSASGGEQRIKIKARDDIEILGKAGVPSARQTTCDSLDDDLIGSLVEISGVVTEKKGTTIMIDDGTDEVRMYIKASTNIDVSVFEEGEEIKVIGIVSKTKTGLRLLPRFDKDISQLSEEEVSTETVLGEVSVSDEWELEKRNKKAEFLKYFSVLAAATIIVSAWFVMKK
jgi:PKD repeat protein